MTFIPMYCVLGKKKTELKAFFQINTKLKCLLLQLHHTDKCSNLQLVTAVSLPFKLALLLMEGRLQGADYFRCRARG